MKLSGKFIVIDGTDGSGKTTQIKLLEKRLKKKGYEVKQIHFPQYNTKSTGLIEEYLNGKYGETDEVNPYAASLFYACDRYDGSLKIKQWLKQGKVIISDRYVAANMGHQGSKIKDAGKRKDYFNWLYNLEYNLFSIPKPDLNIILLIKAEIAQKLSKQRTNKQWHNKTRDIHEENLKHLKEAENTYEEMCRLFDDFSLIKCTKGDQIMTEEEINNFIWDKINKTI